MPEPSPIRASVSPAIFERHPDYVALILTADGVTNGPSDDHSDRALAEAEAAVRARGLERPADDPHLAAWRSAFSAFGAKPSRFPSSAEALAGRVLKGGSLPRINRLVDFYNAVSVLHLVPVGGEDADRLEGGLRLEIAAGGEPFDPGGDGREGDAAAAGEVVWRDDRAVTCRRWNWRQGARTRLTEATRSAFFVFDRLGPLHLDELDAAAARLAALIREQSPEARIEALRLTADAPASA